MRKEMQDLKIIQEKMIKTFIFKAFLKMARDSASAVFLEILFHALTVRCLNDLNNVFLLAAVGFFSVRWWSWCRKLYNLVCGTNNLQVLVSTKLFKIYIQLLSHNVVFAVPGFPNSIFLSDLCNCHIFYSVVEEAFL